MLKSPFSCGSQTRSILRTTVPNIRIHQLVDLVGRFLIHWYTPPPECIRYTVYQTEDRVYQSSVYQPSVSLTKLPLRGIYLPCIVLTNLLTKILSTYRYLPVYLPLLTDMFTTTYRHIYRYLPAVSNLVSDTLGWYTEDWYTLSSVWYTVYQIHSGAGVYQSSGVYLIHCWYTVDTLKTRSSRGVTPRCSEVWQIGKWGVTKWRQGLLASYEFRQICPIFKIKLTGYAGLTIWRFYWKISEDIRTIPPVHWTQ